MSLNPMVLPLGRHLKELRDALIRSFLALLIACALAFYFSDILLHGLTRLMAVQPIFISPAEVLMTDMKIALFAGLALALPMILFEIARFVSPGLLKKEQHLLIPALVGASLSFYIGVAFAYFIPLPFALTFLVAYGQQKGLLAQISIGHYVDFNLHFLFAFGVIFEFPIAMVLLAKTGLLTVPFLVHARKYAIIAAFLIAAVLTPTPDVFNQCLMAIPMILLYEVGLLAVRLLGQSAPQMTTEQN